MCSVLVKPTENATSWSPVGAPETEDDKTSSTSQIINTLNSIFFGFSSLLSFYRVSFYRVIPKYAVPLLLI